MIQGVAEEVEPSRILLRHSIQSDFLGLKQSSFLHHQSCFEN